MRRPCAAGRHGRKDNRNREQVSRTIPTTRRKVYDGNNPDSDGQAYDDLCGTAGLCCRRWAVVLRQLQNSKEAFFPNGKTVWRDRHPAECRCRQATREKQEKEERARLHYEKVQRLKLQGFTDWAMQHWTFANDHGQNPQMQLAQRYVAHWPEMREKNVGLLLWGGVGTGKSFMAGCIANALMEQEVAVCMTNFARIMNELNNAFPGGMKSWTGSAAIRCLSLTISAWSGHGICAGADLQHYRQPLPQQETTDRYHEPDPDGVEEPAGYRTRPYL